MAAVRPAVVSVPAAPPKPVVAPVVVAAHTVVAVTPASTPTSTPISDVFVSSNAAKPSTQVIELGAQKLDPTTPFEVTGIDRSRPIAYVEAKTLDGKPVTVHVGADAQKAQAFGSAANPGFDKPLFGDVLLTGDSKVTSVKIHYADPTASNVDYFSINPAKQGMVDGQEMRLALPPNRATGEEIQVIEVSYWAPVRQWNLTTGREEKPTYSDWYVDDRHLQHKFIDPNQDAGNVPEVDNIYPSNSNDPGSLGPAGAAIRIVAESKKIPSTERAMTVQWVKVTYKPKDTEVKTQSFKGEALPNGEWKGKWINTGERIALNLEPGRAVDRVEIHWSDKPDDYGYETPGKWAVGTLQIDGKTVGTAREHVGSPAWQFFEGNGMKGNKLELLAQDSPIKLFEVNVHYKK